MAYRIRTERLNKAPPVSERPRCPQCNRRLRPFWRSVAWKKDPPDATQGFTHISVLRWDTGEYHGPGYFCTNRCAINWAVDAQHRLRAKR